MTSPSVAAARPLRARATPDRARRTELVMLLFAVLLGTLAVVAVNLGAGAPWASHVGLFGGVLGRWARGRPAAAPAGGPAQRRGAGADLPPGHRLCGPGAGVPARRPTLQLAWTAIGVLLFAGVLLVISGHHRLQRYAYTAALAGLVLLFLPAVLPARFSEVNGAKLWIRVGGLSVQPSEIAKILLVVFFADYFTRKRDVLALARRAVLLGTLGQALPALTISDPVPAVILAALLLGETLPLTPAALTGDPLAVGLVGAGVIRLARAEDSSGSGRGRGGCRGGAPGWAPA